MGDIIVITKSGGQGTCLVKFRGYMPRVGLLTEAAVWVDESKLFEEKTTNLSKSRVFSPSAALHTDPVGVAPEETGYVIIFTIIMVDVLAFVMLLVVILKIS